MFAGNWREYPSNSVDVYERDGGWSRTATLEPPERDGDRSFGRGVAVEGDAALVGDIGPYSAGDPSKIDGTVHVYERGDDGWTRASTLSHPDGMTPYSFGWSVALAGDWAFVAAPDANEPERSVVVVYRSGDEGWHHRTTLEPERSGWIEFGRDLATDGNRLLVGAPPRTSGDEEAAGAYYFEFRDGEWTQVTKLGPETRTMDYGRAVALGGDTALVGDPARFSPDGYPPNQGAVEVFEQGEDDWTRAATLRESHAVSRDRFGRSAALTCGGTALVGTPAGNRVPDGTATEGTSRDGEVTGTVSHFAPEDGEWTEVERLAPEELSSGAEFGRCVAAGPHAAFVGSRAGEWVYEP